MITIDIDKAKTISHDIRRAARAAEFQPLDMIIALQIPGITTQETEAKRTEIREKYAAIQTEIDAAQDADTLLGIVQALGA